MFRHASIPEKGSGDSNNNKAKLHEDFAIFFNITCLLVFTVYSSVSQPLGHSVVFKWATEQGEKVLTIVVF